MIQKIKAPVTVISIYKHRQNKAFPLALYWEGRKFKIRNVDLHHSYKKGKILYHVFSVSSKNHYFRLALNTSNLFWTLEEVSDGIPD